MWMDILAPYDGVDYPPNGFLLHCQFYYESLVEPKPEESRWVGCMIYCLTGPACQWTRYLVTVEHPSLRDSNRIASTPELLPETERVASTPELMPEADRVGLHLRAHDRGLQGGIHPRAHSRG